MVYCYSEEDKKRIGTRLNRISGQINGINKMIQDNRDCIDVLNQLLAVQSAVKGVWSQVVKGHLEHCVVDALKNNKHSEEIIEELVQHLEKLR